MAFVDVHLIEEGRVTLPDNVPEVFDDPVEGLVTVVELLPGEERVDTSPEELPDDGRVTLFDVVPEEVPGRVTEILFPDTPGLEEEAEVFLSLLFTLGRVLGRVSLPDEGFLLPDPET